MPGKDVRITSVGWQVGDPIWQVISRAH